MTYRKKLIEVALPLEAINEESSRRKRKAPAGYPTMLHKWWAQRPLAACRAVLFASLVDDPSSRPEEFPTEEAQKRERQRLFRLLEELVRWENSTNETVLAAARTEIFRSTDGAPPPLLDPFCGGGSIPLEAQRLGLEAYGSDLNPVPVLITKALIELPAKFAGRPPINPDSRRSLTHEVKWNGARGLAEDVRYYGRWMRSEAERRIGHVFPSVQLPSQHGGGGAAVVAYLWARTVACPNPACGAMMPLAATYILSAKGAEFVWVEPRIHRTSDLASISFQVQSGSLSPSRRKLLASGSSAISTNGKRAKAAFMCAACTHGTASGEYVDQEAEAGRLGLLPLALVVETAGRRRFIDADPEALSSLVNTSAEALTELNQTNSSLSAPARGTFASNAQGRRYGFHVFADYFTPRQLLVHLTLSNLVRDVQERVVSDILDAKEGGHSGSIEPVAGREYAKSISLFLAFALSRGVDYNSKLSTWRSKDNALRSTLAKQGVQMAWDFVEANPFGNSSGSIHQCVDVVAKCIEYLPARMGGNVSQCDARRASAGRKAMICTDPPYYSNIGYSDLSDYLYVWLRQSLAADFPELLSTLLTPKVEELVADHYRFAGDRDAAAQFFQSGLFRVFENLASQQHPDYPLTVFYAFKQAETGEGEEQNERGLRSEVASTGWERMLQGMVDAGLAIVGTWPMRTEGDNRQVGVGANALASSVVLVCRPRARGASQATRRELLGDLHRELPLALRALQHGNIAPVDLAQAAIGPGMAVFSRYSRVLESDGSPMRVRTALALINQALAETLAEQEGEMDADTRWALTWFDQYGFAEGPFGDADTLAKAKNTATEGLVQAGIVRSARGKVRLLRRDELPEKWDPAADARRTVWEATHHLIRTLETQGEQPAAALLARLGDDGERARDLAYRLYTTCERRGWAQDAQAYNSLVVAWPELTRVTVDATPGKAESPAQATLEL